MYQIVQVPDDAASMSEQIGTKFKFWYYNESGESFLFKAGRAGTGENWAEKVNSELCTRLGLPSAKYELARWQDQNGVICENFVPNGGRLVHGNELLADIRQGYPTTKFYGVQDHTLRLVLTIMRSKLVKPPIGFEKTPDIQIALDVFIGYLMFDAYISNQDRHHENWGLIFFSEKGVSFLAPSYDHASSLGRNESDDKRQLILNAKGSRGSLENYVARAMSTFFYDSRKSKRRLGTVDAFFEASKKHPRAALAWIEKLNLLKAEDIDDIFSNIPSSEISETAVEFASKMLSCNRERLLALRGELQ